MKSFMVWTTGVLAVSLLLLAVTSLAQQPTAENSNPQTPGMSMPSMTSPMMGMMNPMDMISNPSGSCVQCHDGEDIARYQELMRPMMEMMQKMMDPATMMNPSMYMQMMAAPMDPKMYTEWFNAWTKMMSEMAKPVIGE